MLDSVDRTIFINNVHDKITEDLLYELFLQVISIIFDVCYNK